MAASSKAYTLTPEMIAYAREVAPRWNVSPELHEHDQLMGYFINNARMDPIDAVKSYFAGGSSDARSIVALADRLGVSKQMLEFASGYGRVTRHLPPMLGGRPFLASDIHDNACEFISDKLGVNAVVSTTQASDLKIADKQEFIFVLSFFSHLPEASFGPWIKALYDMLSPGGYLMFTTHGDYALNHNPEWFGIGFDRAKGFGFRPDSDQADLDNKQYGTAVVSNAFVEKTFSVFAPDAELHSFSSRAWFGLQDEWIIHKP